jgi:hypothetical protein
MTSFIAGFRALNYHGIRSAAASAQFPIKVPIPGIKKPRRIRRERQVASERHGPAAGHPQRAQTGRPSAKTRFR